MLDIKFVIYHCDIYSVHLLCTLQCSASSVKTFLTKNYVYCLNEKQELKISFT